MAGRHQIISGHPNANVKDRFLCLSLLMGWFLHSRVLKIYAQKIQSQSGASHHGKAQLDTKSIIAVERLMSQSS